MTAWPTLSTPPRRSLAGRNVLGHMSFRGRRPGVFTPSSSAPVTGPRRWPTSCGRPATGDPTGSPARRRVLADARRPQREDEPMTDRMPDDLGELDDMIAFDMLAAAMQGVADADEYAAERDKHTAEHGLPDPASFPRWSEISAPGTEEYGPYTRPWLGEDDSPQPL